MATDAWKAVLERLDRIDNRFDRLDERLDRLDGRQNGMDQKLWAALTALLVLLFTIIGWLLATSPPWSG